MANNYAADDGRGMIVGHINALDQPGEWHWQGNTFINNAAAGGAVVDIQGGTEDIQLAGNTFTETRPGITTRSVQQGPDSKNIGITGSKLEGVQEPVTLPEK